tara:strand:- start:753 stop:1712 length:960 start_codon:yes stop_codon:yes gene_type:complete
MKESNIINDYLKKLVIYNNSSLKLNDDVFFDKLKKLVISVDTYIEGSHFIDFKKPELVIKKIIRSSISDLICKGVTPKHYFIAGAGNRNSFNKFNLKKILRSLHQEQKKFNISLGGGDTVFSKKLSFTITTIGYSKKIIKRNNVKLNDDIYVTGNLGDSFIGLNILKKKIKVNNDLKKYFENKFYQPSLHLKFSRKLSIFANSSIDISDGLVTDLEKLINKQNLSYRLLIDRIPISSKLKKLISLKKIKKELLVSNGDDYQILFTAKPSKNRIILKIAKSFGTKISKIGKICSSSTKSEILDQKGMKIRLKNKGYFHKF